MNELDLIYKTAEVTKSPSDGSGTFEFSVSAFDTVDSEKDLIKNYTNVEDNVAVVPMDYGHLAIIGRGADPLAVKIGEAKVLRDGTQLIGSAKLDLENRVAAMVYERLLLPSDDPAYLGEVSVWFAFDPRQTEQGEDGVRIINDAELISIAVVKTGAQETAISKVKAAYLSALLDAAHAKNVYTYLPGSVEAASQDVWAAVREWADKTYPQSPTEMGAYVSVAGTYPDRVVVCVESYGNDSGMKYFEIPYTRDGEVVTLGAPTEVDITAQVTPVKSQEDTVDTEQKTETEAKWDGDAALASCDNAAEFAKIAFRRDNDADPDTPGAWVLPHHPNPEGAPDNADPTGVGAALGSLSGARGNTPDVRDAAAARTHLENHRDSFKSDEEKAVAGEAQKAVEMKAVADLTAEITAELAFLDEPAKDLLAVDKPAEPTKAADVKEVPAEISTDELRLLLDAEIADLD